MGDARARSSGGGFWSFYRGYTDTSVHTATMAALTAFGLLTFVHRAFVAVAVGAYVLPPIALYLTRDEGEGEDEDEGVTRETSADESADSDRPAGANADAAADAPDARDGSDGDAPAAWAVEATPTDATLRDATALSAGAVAVGDGGVVLGRGVEGGSDAGEEWAVLVADGPAAEGRDLTGVAATDDGAAAWLCGANGAVGRYDAETGRHADHSAPRDVTDSWTDVAVAGTAGEETVFLANGSGELVRGTVRDGEASWDAPVAPGSGSSIAALDAADGGLWACDTSGGAFESADAASGELRFARVGVDGASGTFTDVAAAGGRVRVTADDGSVYRDDAGWTRDRPVETRLAGVDADADACVAVGDGGTVCRDGGDGWATVPVPTDASLEAVHLGADAAVAVGDAGTVLRVGGAGGGASVGGAGASDA